MKKSCRKKRAGKINHAGGVFQLLVVAMCVFAGCGPKRPAESSHKLTGSPAERVAAVSKLLTSHSPLPSPLLDANFVQEQIGDGRLGPSDFRSFCVLSVNPADLPAWRKALPPLEAHNTPPKCVAPKQAPPWWLTPADFPRLAFYSPKSLTGRGNGWVGIASDGKIYVFSFTM